MRLAFVDFFIQVVFLVVFLVVLSLIGLVTTQILIGENQII